MSLRSLYPMVAEDLDPREFPEAFTRMPRWEPDREPGMDEENWPEDPLKFGDEMPNDMNYNFPPNEAARLPEEFIELDRDIFEHVEVSDEREEEFDDDK